MPSAEYTEAQREYREVYLRSDHWQEVRKAALERAGRRCQVCNGDKQLDVHHRTYERKGREEPGDVTVLCRKCHETFHGNGKIVRSRPEKKKRTDNYSMIDPFQRATLKRKILDVLYENRPSLTAAEVAAIIGCRTQVAGSCLVVLRREGKVWKIKKRWGLKAVERKARNPKPEARKPEPPRSVPLTADVLDCIRKQS
jgi:hypothetical protein